MLLPCFCLAFQEMQQLTSTSGMHLQLLKPDLKLPGLQKDLHLPDLKDLQLPSLQLLLPDLKLPQQKLTGLNLSFFGKLF